MQAPHHQGSAPREWECSPLLPSLCPPIWARPEHINANNNDEDLGLFNGFQGDYCCN